MSTPPTLVDRLRYHAIAMENGPKPRRVLLHACADRMEELERELTTARDLHANAIHLLNAANDKLRAELASAIEAKEYWMRHR